LGFLISVRINYRIYQYKDSTVSPQQFGKVKLLNELKIVDGRNTEPFSVEGRIRWTQDRIREEVAQGTIFLFKSIDLNPRFLRKGSNGNYRTPNTNLNKEVGVMTNEDGAKRLVELDLKDMFTNPKPTSLIKYLINIVGHEHPDITILDFFAGSSTTADAVMQLNAEDGGNRKFIMVQLPEKTYHTNKDGKEVPTKGGKAAYDAGFKSIDKISRERIRRAAKKISEDSELALPEGFDGSFKHYHVAKPVRQTLEKIDHFDQNNTNLFTDMVAGFSSQNLEVAGDASGEETILTTWLAKDGYPFDAEVQNTKIGNYTAHKVEDSRLYLINEGWGTDQTKELLNELGTYRLEVQSVVIFGYSFNVAELRELENGLKQLDSKVTLIKRY